MAREWAQERNIPFTEVLAEWDRYGRAAGPLRNKKMLEEKPDLVVAFTTDIETSRGTANMVKQARQAGIPVVIKSPAAG